MRLPPERFSKKTPSPNMPLRFTIALLREYKVREFPLPHQTELARAGQNPSASIVGHAPEYRGAGYARAGFGFRGYCWFECFHLASHCRRNGGMGAILNRQLIYCQLTVVSRETTVLVFHVGGQFSVARPKFLVAFVAIGKPCAPLGDVAANGGTSKRVAIGIDRISGQRALFAFH